MTVVDTSSVSGQQAGRGTMGRSRRERGHREEADLGGEDGFGDSATTLGDMRNALAADRHGRLGLGRRRGIGS